MKTQCVFVAALLVLALSGASAEINLFEDLVEDEGLALEAAAYGSGDQRACSLCSSDNDCNILCNAACKSHGYSSGSYVFGTCVTCQCYKGALVDTKTFTAADLF